MGKPGRPKGSTTKPQLRDHFTPEEVTDLVRTAKKKAKTGDTKLLVFLLEQIYGKAPQSIEFPAGDLKITWKSE